MAPRRGAGSRPQAEPSGPREARPRGPGEAPRAAPGIVEVEHIVKRFGARCVLDDVSLQVERGARLGVIGPAAGGKSVLLKIIARLIAPDRGDVRVGGTVGMLFQNSALFDFLDVFDNVAFPLVQAGGDRRRDRGRSRTRACARSASPAPSASCPAELSGGMKKRVGLARATVARADVVLYDEPTAGLDPVTTSKIYELLRHEHPGPKRGRAEGEARAERSEDPGKHPEGRVGSTAVIVSSDVEAVARFADTIAFLDGGRVRWLGPAAQLFDADDRDVRHFARGAA